MMNTQRLPNPKSNQFSTVHGSTSDIIVETKDYGGKILLKGSSSEVATRLKFDPHTHITRTKFCRSQKWQEEQIELHMFYQPLTLQ